MAYSYVQSAYASAISGGANQSTNSINVTGQHSLIAWVLQTNAYISGISDTQGNAWSNVGISPQIAGVFYLLCYLCQNAQGGGTVFTNTNTVGWAIDVMEYANLATGGGALGYSFAANGNVGIGNDTLSTGSTASISNVPAAVIGFCVDESGTANSSSAPILGTTQAYNSRAVGWAGQSSQAYALAEDYRLTSAGTAACTFGTNSGNQYANFGMGCIVLQELTVVTSGGYPLESNEYF